MIHFFGVQDVKIIALATSQPLSAGTFKKLHWLFGEASHLMDTQLSGGFYGPRASMVTPWSTNAVEITQNMGISGIDRIETYLSEHIVKDIDRMLVTRYEGLDQKLLDVDVTPDPVQHVQDISQYNIQEGLSLSIEEIDYLEQLARNLDRPLTDSEVFGFSQVNSEHCRHKIFNGQFVINGEEKDNSLFELIKKTSALLICARAQNYLINQPKTCSTTVFARSAVATMRFW